MSKQVTFKMPKIVSKCQFKFYKCQNVFMKLTLAVDVFVRISKRRKQKMSVQNIFDYSSKLKIEFCFYTFSMLHASLLLQTFDQKLKLGQKNIEKCSPTTKGENVTEVILGKKVVLCFNSKNNDSTWNEKAFAQIK